LENFVYFLDENCRMDGLVYKNKIMSIRVCIGEQINDGAVAG
jgi:hypothetical protein